VLKPEQPAWLPALELRGRADNRPASPSDPLLLQVPSGHVEHQLVKRFALGSAMVRSCRLLLANEEDTTIHIIDPG
jgi:hypothetical protein